MHCSEVSWLRIHTSVHSSVTRGLPATIGGAQPGPTFVRTPAFTSVERGEKEALVGVGYQGRWEGMR